MQNNDTTITLTIPASLAEAVDRITAETSAAPGVVFVQIRREEVLRAALQRGIVAMQAEIAESEHLATGGAS